jgi:hypothetical protein
MTLEQQKAHIEQMAARRDALQKQIAELNAQRQQFIDEQMRKSGNPADKAFDAALLRALREQAQRKGFEFGQR